MRSPSLSVDRFLQLPSTVLYINWRHCSHSEQSPYYLHYLLSVLQPSLPIPRLPSMDDIFDVENDNNPLWYQSSPQNPPLTEPPNDLVNSSLGLSQRIRKLLRNPNLSIDIISTERVMNSVVVYLIELKPPSAKTPEDCIIVKRRYSEFKSLRDNLVKLFPSIIVPPIPEKHSLLTYLLHSIDSSKEVSVIDLRRRYFVAFLHDIVFDANPLLRDCPLLHKFLDPNYESCWENAVNEPPVSLLPSNLLLANPNDPTDQNGLYLLLPPVHGFDINSPDNLSLLKKINEDIHKLHADISLFDSKEQKSHDVVVNDNAFADIPVDLVNFEINFHHNIKVLHDVQKLNSRNTKNIKLLINVLVELGGNLNNFSLQVHDPATPKPLSLSTLIERFGSTMDSNFLTFEHFLDHHVVPDWQEPTNQFLQYYFSALQLIKYYKYKLTQYRLVYKLKFNKVQEMANFSNGYNSIKHLKDLNINSPTINRAIKNIEAKQKSRGLSSKKSWYGLFGGSRPSFSLPETRDTDVLQNEGGPNEPLSTRTGENGPDGDVKWHYRNRIQHIEKELHKLDQLIQLANDDMIKLTQNLQKNFHEFLEKMENKWLLLMLEFVRAGQRLFSENLASWEELKRSIE